MADVEAALYAEGSDRPPDRFVDPIAVAGLIVNVAALAWTVYTNLKDKTPKPQPEVIARAVLVELKTSDSHPDPAQDKVIEVVVTEVIKATREPETSRDG